ncbi:MAG: polyprenyl synthetase family protein [Oscillospiraceae bacterium]|nr:polyprenyl synthetase family protein [Oscillospiraceae bacterium]
MADFSEFASDIKLINDFLKNEAFECCESSVVLDAMNYSLKNGGKRIRPLLTLYFSELSGGDYKSAIKLGCALEMIHTYSLIHDDLPCMDNDDTRRGKPSCHIAYGEANALLAGDALLTEAFYLATQSGIPAENVSLAVKCLSEFAGVRGMVMGQVLDLQFENTEPTLSDIKKMYSLKTCALLKCACVLGYLTGKKVEKKEMDIICEYAENLGLAFQITDDILDIVSDSQTLGKPVGSDEKNNKPTFVKLYGLEKSKALVNELTNNAISILGSYNNSEKLIKLTLALASREF